jgi:hypothetical protein
LYLLLMGRDVGGSFDVGIFNFGELFRGIIGK